MVNSEGSPGSPVTTSQVSRLTVRLVSSLETLTVILLVIFPDYQQFVPITNMNISLIVTTYFTTVSLSRPWAAWDWGGSPRHTWAAEEGTTPPLCRWPRRGPGLSCCSRGHTGTWSAARSGSSWRRACTRRGPCCRSEGSFHARWSQGTGSTLWQDIVRFKIRTFWSWNIWTKTPYFLT